MQLIKNRILPVEKITEGAFHYFFGYYDLQPWSENGKYHLCSRVKFMDRLPEAADVCELGMIRMSDRQFIPFAKTTAWNFQQGAMLQWNPIKQDEEVIYNIREGLGFRSVVLNIKTGAEKILPLPVACVNPTGRYALSINFSRMFDFRPGYGYQGIADSFSEDKYPSDDGIYLMDMKTGDCRLIISLRGIAGWHMHAVGMESRKYLINHITFNTDGTRFLFLARTFPKDGSGWGTALFSSNTDGSGLYCLSDYSSISHYCWRDPGHILIYADIGNKGKAELYLLKDKENHTELINSGYFLSDGHCSYNQDKTRILFDSYPDADGFKNLYLYDLKKRKGITLASLYSPSVSNVDIRCDLHPRWNRDGSAISFDSTHEGHRHVYLMALDGVEKYFHAVP